MLISLALYPLELSKQKQDQIETLQNIYTRNEICSCIIYPQLYQVLVLLSVVVVQVQLEEVLTRELLPRLILLQLDEENLG